MSLCVCVERERERVCVEKERLCVCREKERVSLCVEKERVCVCVFTKFLTINILKVLYWKFKRRVF